MIKEELNQNVYPSNHPTKKSLAVGGSKAWMSPNFWENCRTGLFLSDLNAGHSFGQTLCFMFSPSCLLKSPAAALVSGFALLAPSRHVSDTSWSTGG